MSRFVRLAGALLLGLAVVAPALAEQRTVRVYNWSDYIDETVLSDFTDETGVAVVYDVFDSNDILETKLLAGSAGYDLVFPSGQFMARQIRAGVFRKLDRAKLPNWKHLDPAVMAKVERYDPGNEHGVVYMWGTTGIAYNEAKIRERVPEGRIDSWAAVFDPERAKLVADCGIYILDAPDEIIAAALLHLGLDPDSKDPDVIAKAEPLLMALRPHVRKFHSSETINALANGDICLAVMWSGDAKIAASRAAEADAGVTLTYVIPKEGAQLWFDLMAIPKDAPNPDDAHRLMNFLMEPEVIARCSNVVTYPNANVASRPFIDEEVLNDPGIYPPPEVLDRLFVLTPYDQRLQRVVTRLWQRVRTGG